MAEYDFSKMDYTLRVKGNYDCDLDIEAFSQMMKNPSSCYKFYWLEALAVLISEGVTETTFNDMIDEMIANGWYSVREFHIHLSGLQSGQVRDGLERAILELARLSGLPANASKTEIKNAVRAHDPAIKAYKEQLTHMVPYRALSGFFNRSEVPAAWGNITRLVKYAEWFSNSVTPLPYTLGRSGGLKRELYFHPSWIKMIQDNMVSIMGWIQYEKVKWLQMNNPEVPGLVYKLAPLDERMRRLGSARRLWEAVFEIRPVYDVFTEQKLQKERFEVDHFIPWSFVMNDELWNLMPMDASLNASKSNRLPRWEPFFPRFAGNQFMLYGLIQEKPAIRNLYENCYKDNLHSIWASQELYRSGNTKEEFFHILKKNMQPVYDSARRQGYEIWRF